MIRSSAMTSCDGLTTLTLTSNIMTVSHIYTTPAACAAEVNADVLSTFCDRIAVIRSFSHPA